MYTLDVYKDRRFNVVNIGSRSLKIPSEYLVEEVERILELQVLRKNLDKKVWEDPQEEIKQYFDLVFGQLEIMFQHHQPEITADEIKKLITEKEALGILGFFDDHRALKNKTDSVEDTENKKKILN